MKNKKNKYHHFEKHLEEVWQQVPVDYYQKGIEINLLQRIWHGGRLKAVLEFLKQEKPVMSNKIKVLDVGCASGWFISEIASHYPRAEHFGLDIYRDAIDYAKTKYPHISFVYGDGHKLAFPDNSYDVVICTNVLEHVVDPKKIMKEINRVLKIDGIAIIGMDSENWLFKLVWYIWRKLNGRVWKDAHLHVLRPDKLDRLFQETGLTMKKRRFFNFGMAIVFLLKK